MAEKLTVFCNTPIDEEMDMRLRLAAAKRRLTRSAVCRKAFEHFLEKIEKEEADNGRKIKG